MNTIRTADLKTMFDSIIEKLDSLGIEQVEIATDWYSIITADEWTKFEKAEPVVGSLKDDIEGLTLMINDPERVCTFVDFDRVSSVLRAISQELNPAE